MTWHPIIERVKETEEAPYTYLNVSAGSISALLQTCIEVENKKNPDFPSGFVLAFDAPTWTRIVRDTNDETSMMRLLEIERDPDLVAMGLVGKMFGLEVVSDYKMPQMSERTVFRHNIAFYPIVPPTENA